MLIDILLGQWRASWTGRAINASTKCTNEHGVVITLASKLEGFQLTLGAEGFRIALD